LGHENAFGNPLFIRPSLIAIAHQVIFRNRNSLQAKTHERRWPVNASIPDFQQGAVAQM
jgi:hypothetical protein